MVIAAFVRRQEWGLAVAAVQCAQDAHVGAKDCPIQISLILDSRDVAQLFPIAASETVNPVKINLPELTGQHPTNEVVSSIGGI